MNLLHNFNENINRDNSYIEAKKKILMKKILKYLLTIKKSNLLIYMIVRK